MRQGGGDCKQACAQRPCVRVVYTMFSITVSSQWQQQQCPNTGTTTTLAEVRRSPHDSNSNTTTSAEVSTTTTSTAAVTPPSIGAGDKTAGSTCCSRAPMPTLSVSMTTLFLNKSVETTYVRTSIATLGGGNLFRCQSASLARSFQRSFHISLLPSVKMKSQGLVKHRFHV